MRLLLEIHLILVLLGQAPAPLPPADDPVEFAAAAGARLAYLKKSVTGYEIRPADDTDGAPALALQREPVLRFTNPVGRSRDGAVFLWNDRGGRPGVVAQATLNLRGIWVHEFSSLSPRRLVVTSGGQVVWNPPASVEFRPIPGAPSPADTAEQRSAQVRALVREFTIEDNFERKGWQALRPMAKPFARYGKAGSGLVDGSLICFVLTTDPEAYLMLEARADAPGGRPTWRYGLAPSTMYPLRASLKGTTIWERNIEGPDGGPDKSIVQMYFSDAKITAGSEIP